MSTLPGGTAGRSLQSTARGNRPLVRALRRRRDLRAGLVQTVYVVIGFLLGLTLPGVDAGPTIAPDAISPLVLGIAGAFISFIALVFSLLFLVVQYGNTTVSPRLTLFRDAPLVWHTFGFFVAVFVYATVAGVRLGTISGDVTILVPLAAIAMVLVALILSRTLQMQALRLLQFSTTMEEIRRRGEVVVGGIYRRMLPAPVRDAEQMPPVATVVRWDRPTSLLRQIDLPKLYADAVRLDAVIVVETRVGEELRRGRAAVTGYAATPLDLGPVLDTFSTGQDRTFVQDPLFAFRLLSDIGDRALSSAINDPATAVQVLGCVQDLLTQLVVRDLDIGRIVDDEDRLRVVVPLPTWDEYVAAGIDEIKHYGADAPTVLARIDVLLDELIEIAPPERREPLERRRRA